MTYQPSLNLVCEEWRSIPGWEGFYDASSLGRIRSISRKAGMSFIRGRIRAVRTDRDGYQRLNMTRGKSVPETCKVAELVMLAFVGERPDGYVIRHKDGDKSNNALTNLAYGTVEENLEDQKRHGTFPNKITPQQAREIYIRANADQSRGSLARLAEEYGLGSMQIARIKNRQRWKALLGAA